MAKGRLVPYCRCRPASCPLAPTTYPRPAHQQTLPPICSPAAQRAAPQARHMAHLPRRLAALLLLATVALALAAAPARAAPQLRFKPDGVSLLQWLMFVSCFCLLNVVPALSVAPTPPAACMVMAALCAACALPSSGCLPRCIPCLPRPPVTERTFLEPPKLPALPALHPARQAFK